MTQNYSQNPKAIKSRLYRYANIDAVRKREYDYYMSHKEQRRASLYKWIAAHLEYHTAYNRLGARIQQAQKKGNTALERQLIAERKLLQTTLSDRKQIVR